MLKGLVPFFRSFGFKSEPISSFGGNLTSYIIKAFCTLFSATARIARQNLCILQTDRIGQIDTALYLCIIPRYSNENDSVKPGYRYQSLLPIIKIVLSASEVPLTVNEPLIYQPEAIRSSTFALYRSIADWNESDKRDELSVRGY